MNCRLPRRHGIAARLATKVAAAAVVVASSSTQRNDENLVRTTSTTTKTHSNRRAFLVSSTSLFSLCVAALAGLPLPSRVAAHAATITIKTKKKYEKNLRQVLESKIQKTKCPAVLRVAFHDAGTFNKASNDGGMNGSVLYELGRPESFGLKRGLNPIKEVYEEMKSLRFRRRRRRSIVSGLHSLRAERNRTHWWPKILRIHPAWT